MYSNKAKHIKPWHHNMLKRICSLFLLKKWCTHIEPGQHRLKADPFPPLHNDKAEALLHRQDKAVGQSSPNSL